MKGVHFLFLTIFLNPEVDPRLKKHAVLISYPSGNGGFEESRQNAGSDHDFK